MSERRFLVVFHPGRDETLRTASSVCRRLVEAGVTPVLVAEEREALVAHAAEAEVVATYDPDAPEGIELVMTLGGDGTILRAAELQRATGAPLLGINMGHVGFLAEAEVADLQAVVDRAVARDYEVESRLTLDVRVVIDDVEVARTWAVNEAAIEKHGAGRMIEALLEVDDRPISSFGTDAVLLATPTGSTAYSFSAGGPIVWPTAQVMLMVPLGAHALFTRPLVVGPDATMSVTISHHSTSEAVLWCDSRRSVDLPQGARVEARRSETPLRLARLSTAPFSDRLVAKLDLPVQGWRDAARSGS
ncbi:NAD kinase [Agrococcus sp. SGAir0287]|uniref:NAD kinase n=1 Tax=Agrococcus sp. SGAir0287 TaxID=2070347 RepID=UPI0010CCDA90|nr:NAD kinase [Agrococcus sp. SGAir0287]QCR20777.1 NAD kinase [Agrococcus sp. SGAir0287]